MKRIFLVCMFVLGLVSISTLAYADFYPRFKNNGDGTVTDNLTGLMWLKDANCITTKYPGIDKDGTFRDGAVTWQHALNFVAGINNGTYSRCDGGYTDWRLPSLKQLLSLTHYGFYNPSLPNTAGTGKWSEGDPFTGVKSSSSAYWSSTTFAGMDEFAWGLITFSGSVGHTVKSDSHYVWPVRGGN